MRSSFRTQLAVLALGLSSCAPPVQVLPPPPESVADLAPDAGLHGIVMGW
ncbi:MAG TPA: hypothetical protein VFT04_12380 [Gemmatimonadales bacterium]|nr:hypothetical protein [Gemmatimonadales bacterium]